MVAESSFYVNSQAFFSRVSISSPPPPPPVGITGLVLFYSMQYDSLLSLFFFLRYTLSQIWPVGSFSNHLLSLGLGVINPLTTSFLSSTVEMLQICLDIFLPQLHSQPLYKGSLVSYMAVVFRNQDLCLDIHIFNGCTLFYCIDIMYFTVSILGTLISYQGKTRSNTG